MATRIEMVHEAENRLAELLQEPTSPSAVLERLVREGTFSATIAGRAFNDLVAKGRVEYLEPFKIRIRSEGSVPSD